VRTNARKSESTTKNLLQRVKISVLPGFYVSLFDHSVTYRAHWHTKASIPVAQNRSEEMTLLVLVDAKVDKKEQSAGQ
jgi:hypothetical protein